jgi:hypothetical protein
MKPPDDKHLTFDDFWKIIKPYRKKIIRNVMILSIVTAGLSLLLPNWYKGTAVILPLSKDSNAMSSMSILQDFGLGGIIGGEERLNRILAILKSKSLQESLINQYNLIERYEVENLEEAILILEGNIEVVVEDEMQIYVSFWDKDQEMVAEMTNSIITSLDSLNILLNVKKGRNNRIFIESRINEVLDSLRMLEKSVIQMMENDRILSIEDQVRVGVEKAAEIKALIMAKEIELAVAQKIYDKNNPTIRLLKSELNILSQKYIEYFESNKNDQIIPDFTKIPDLGVKFKRLERTINYYIKILEYLGPQYESARIEEVKMIPTFQILDRAMRPEKKDKPRRSLIVLAVFVLTLMLNLYYVYWREQKLSNK